MLLAFDNNAASAAAILWIKVISKFDFFSRALHLLTPLHGKFVNINPEHRPEALTCPHSLYKSFELVNDWIQPSADTIFSDEPLQQVNKSYQRHGMLVKR